MTSFWSFVPLEHYVILGVSGAVVLLILCVMYLYLDYAEKKEKV